MKPVPSTEQEKMQLITEARQLNVALPIIVPMLERRAKGAMQRLMSAHRDGKPSDQNAIAELYVIDSIQSELRSKIDALNFQEKK